jgi:acetyl-CoA synthetase
VSVAAEFFRARDFLLAHRTDYAAACRGFSWPRLEEFNWALDYFDVMANGNERTALRVVDEAGGECDVSFARMSERSNQVANFLHRLGVRRGDRVLIMLGNEAALWETLLAAFKLGAVVIPAATLLTKEDLHDRMERGAVRHVVAAAAQTDKFSGLAGSVTCLSAGGRAEGWRLLEDAYGESTCFAADGPTRTSDPLLLYFTSGTTAKAKLVLHSHQSYPVGHLATMYWLGLQPGDLHWNISSPGWGKHAWSSFFGAWTAGATVFAYNYARFHASEALRTVVRYGITTLCAPPTVWRLLIQEKLAAYPVRLRELISAGEPLNPEVIEQVRGAWGLTIRDGYGQTETAALVGNTPGQVVKAGSMGRPLPGFRVELLDPAGLPGAEGEVCVDLSTGPVGLMLGYAGEDSKTAAAQRAGYYRTGDLAARDADGYITYIGRADDVFKASDYRIGPFELESVLIEHPAVAEAAVVPSPDARRTQVPKAFVTPVPGYEPGRELARELFAYVRGKLAPYKRIRRLEFSGLPKTISGKIRRAELRQSEQGRASSLERRALEFFEDDFPDLR